MSPAWLHCNICRRTASQLQARLSLTNCGLVFCSDCAGAAARRFCRACRGSCKRSVPLNSKAPREVTQLFQSLNTKIRNLNRSSAFQDRQIRSLFTRYYKHRAYFKETMMRYEVEKSKALRRGRHDRAKLDELERREAFIQGRKEHLLMEINERAAQASEGQKRREEDEEKYKEDEMSKSSTTMFGSPPATAKIRRTETVSIFKGRSSFQDSGIMSGDWSSSVGVRTPDNSMDTSYTARESRSPTVEYLLNLSAEKDPNKNKKKYPFFVSVKKNENI